MENDFKYLIDEIRDAYFLIQNERLVTVSKPLAEYLGYSKEELSGMYFLDLIAPEERHRVRELYKTRLTGQQVPNRYQTSVLAKDGTSKPVEVITWLNKSNYQGRPAIAGFIIDITERSKAWKALKDGECKYRTLVENMPQKIFFKDKDSIYVYCNENYARHLAIDPSEIAGKTDHDFFPLDVADKYRSDDKRIMESGQGESIEEKYFNNNEYKIAQTVKMPVKDTTGNVIGVVGMIDDITEKKRADEALRESVERLRLIFECTPDGVVITDKNAVITNANDKALKLYGAFHESELIGKNGLELIVPRQRKTALDYLHRCMDEGLILESEYSVIRADGSNISIDTTAGGLRDGSGNPVGLITVVRDITKEKRIREDKQSVIFEAIKTQEEKKEWITRTLHDHTIQELLIATHRLQDVIEDNFGRLPKRVKSQLEEIRLLTESVISDIRNFITDIRPDVLDDMGLVPALRWLTGRLQDEYKVEAKVLISGDVRRLEPQSELNLFRIAQEALSNVSKHSDASAVKVVLGFEKEKLTLSVSDNGSGFELPDTISQFARRHKLGLIGIVERVQMLEGNYKIESSPERGTVIKVEIDLTNRLHMPESPKESFALEATVATSSTGKKSKRKGKPPARKT